MSKRPPVCINLTKATDFKQEIGCERFYIFRDCRRWLKSMKLTRMAVVFLLIFLLYHYIVDHILNIPPERMHHKSSDIGAEISYRRDLMQIDELKNIKLSINNELRELESKRNKIQDDIAVYQNSLTNIEQTVKRGHADLEGLKRQVLQLKHEELEAQKPKLAPPARLLASVDDNVVLKPPLHHNRCQMHSCFDYSRCSLMSQFPVYAYSNYLEPPFVLSALVSDVVRRVLPASPYTTTNPASACLYVVVVGETEAAAQQHAVASSPSPSQLSAWLRRLPYWRGDGRNHVIVALSMRSTTHNPLLGVDVGRAMVAQSNFADDQFRRGFDVVLPSLLAQRVEEGENGEAPKQEVNDDDADNEVADLLHKAEWPSEDFPMQVPALREYILTFQGEWSSDDDSRIAAYDGEGEEGVETREEKRSDFHTLFTDQLKLFGVSKVGGKYLLQTKCGGGRLVTAGYRSEWRLCGTSEQRHSLLRRSTFVLVPPPEHEFASSALFSARLREALRSGAVPVVLGTHVALPYHEFVEWRRAAVLIPQARLTELPFLLANTPHAEILSMRRQARFIFDTYFSTAPTVLESMLAVVRTRLQIPAVAVADVQGSVVEHPSFKVNERKVQPGDAQSEFGIPPREEPLDSARFARNFTQVTMDAAATWNELPGPFRLYPSTPRDRVLPTDAQYIGSSNGFRPIGTGEGGTGKIYQESLGGNSPREQYTIVMLTYEREQVLLEAIERLFGLPHLNKIVVVWNSPDEPRSDLKWPDIGVEVEVIRAERNSLNNRFLPYRQIATEAVLSIDDDVHLRHDEILFAFRVWRESRDRIVGFPGRFHAWNSRDGMWNYNSNHTCELSMVLTGAAFFHKYYMFLYTYWMPAEIRATVDEFLNCEDIAFNFLVSHFTRLPPIKVTSRWTFKCPGCPEDTQISKSQEHFDERHTCINRFARAYGYVPLIFTQYRADSVLFKTRLPHDKQKCFRFI